MRNHFTRSSDAGLAVAFNTLLIFYSFLPLGCSPAGGGGDDDLPGTPSPTPAVESPTPAIDSPTPAVDSPTPTPDSPTPTPDSPTPTPDSPTPGPTQTPDPRGEAVAFTAVTSGETYQAYSCTASDPADCCLELHIEVATSQAELDALLEAALGPAHEPPITIDFSTDLAILSYNSGCRDGLHKLKVEGAFVNDAVLYLEEQLESGCLSAGAQSRTYNVISVPAVAYEGATGQIEQLIPSCSTRAMNSALMLEVVAGGSGGCPGG